MVGSSEPVLRVRNLCKSFGALQVNRDLSFDLHQGECLAVIGPNGAGKTTLIHQLSGVLPSDSGEIIFAGRDVTHLAAHARARAGLARSFQITAIIGSFSVVENVALAVQARTRAPYRFFGRARCDSRLNAEAYETLHVVGLHDRAMVPAGTLSHGEKRSLELAIALAMKPKALLLDEPMAGMGREEGAHLTGIIQSLKGEHPILLIEHDMEAVFTLASRLAVMVYGEIIAQGPTEEVRRNPDVRAAYLGEDAA